MSLPEPPDLGRPHRRLLLTALAVTVIVGVMLGVRDAPNLNKALGDTDDAMRLVLVRALLHGRGWWDQHIMRLQPPVGVYMHWSRLLDGGIAAMDWVFSLILGPANGEWLTRFLWPLLWIVPAATAALLIARRLGERAPGAVMVCALFLVTNTVLYGQFHPGRIDHHDVQMTCFFLALAGGIQRGPGIKGALLAGIASGIGLAIGLEALVFDAAVGAAIALRFVFDDAEARPLKAYGLSLAGTTLLAFLIQTPPWRWAIPACDALASNSTTAIVVAGLSVFGVATVTRGRGRWTRFALLAVAAVIAAGAYFAVDPRCTKGVFADVDPRIKPIWLNHVQEMRPWREVLIQHPLDALTLAVPVVMGVLGWLWLGRTKATRQDAAWRLTGALLLMSSAAGFAAVRIGGYAIWLAMPVLAVAAADVAYWIARRYGRDNLITLAIAALVLTPLNASWAAIFIHDHLGKPHKPRPHPVSHCFENAPWRALAAAGPPGLVLGEVDLGPFILANTKDSVLAAPYHRMSWGILAARSVLAAPDDGTAEARARALGINYVAECDADAHHADRDGLGPDILQTELDHDENAPDWLERINPSSSSVEFFRVKPLAPASSANIVAAPAPPKAR